jgi:8-oxo-dGTP pyrophosphatase MutT (NUDIX family)
MCAKLLRKKINQNSGLVVYSNKFLSIRHTNVGFGNHNKDYYVVEFGPRIGVILIRDGMVLLVKQYRFLIDGYSFELPGGSVDNGESLEQAAIRECIEETGYVCDNLEKLVVYYPGLDNVENRTTIFYTSSMYESIGYSVNKQEIEGLEWVPIKECVTMIKTGKILDAMTICGIFSFIAIFNATTNCK